MKNPYTETELISSRSAIEDIRSCKAHVAEKFEMEKPHVVHEFVSFVGCLWECLLLVFGELGWTKGNLVWYDVCSVDFYVQQHIVHGLEQVLRRAFCQYPSDSWCLWLHLSRTGYINPNSANSV